MSSQVESVNEVNQPIPDGGAGEPSSAGQTQTEGTQRKRSSPDAVEVETQETKRNKRLTSSVWNLFKRVTINGTLYGICSKCGAKLKANPKNGTRSLLDHKEKHEKENSRDIRQMCNEANEKTKKADTGNHYFDQEMSRLELAKMIVLHEYPLSIVNHIGFRNFVHSLQPQFKIVSRNTVKSDILKLYEAMKAKMMKVMEKLESKVAITTDMWSCDHTKKGFMAVTSHYIEESWKLQSLILRFVYVPSPHTKEVLSDVLVDTLLDWNIDRKISTVTVDNCSPNDAILKSILDKIASTNFIMDGTLLHMRCCAHILNLIVKDGLDVIGEGIEKIRSSVGFWIASASRIKTFEDAAKQLRVPCVKKLGLDCKTRWNSTYLMLEVAIAYKDVFTRLRTREKLYTCYPAERDWDVAKEICEKLKIFYNVTELFSGSQYPTANVYFPKICDIKLYLIEWNKSSNLLVKLMASRMTEKYDKYWSVCNTLMAVACVLDPRFKLKLVEYYFSMLYPEDALEEIARIRNHCYDILHDYQLKMSSSDLDPYSYGASSSSLGNSVCVDSVDNADPLAKFDKFVNVGASNSIIKSELDFYLEESVLPRTPDFDVLGWWKTHGIKFPTLQKIARDLLAIPVSTVASESAFSTSGRIISPHRSRLRPETLEALMCTRSWLWNELNASTSLAECLSSASTYCEEDPDEASGR